MDEPPPSPPPEETTSTTDHVRPESTGPSEIAVDPELLALAAPSDLLQSDSANGRSPIDNTLSYPTSDLREPGAPMTITESIALAPQPRTTDFSMLPLHEEGIDLGALEKAAEDGTPGSPTGKLMKTIAPPNAAQSHSNWSSVSEGCLSYFIIIALVALPQMNTGSCHLGTMKVEETLMRHFRCDSHHPMLVSTCSSVSGCLLRM